MGSDSSGSRSTPERHLLVGLRGRGRRRRGRNSAANAEPGRPRGRRDEVLLLHLLPLLQEVVGDLVVEASGTGRARPPARRRRRAPWPCGGSRSSNHFLPVGVPGVDPDVELLAVRLLDLAHDRQLRPGDAPGHHPDGPPLPGRLQGVPKVDGEEAGLGLSHQGLDPLLGQGPRGPRRRGSGRTGRWRRPGARCSGPRPSGAPPPRTRRRPARRAPGRGPPGRARATASVVVPRPGAHRPPPLTSRRSSCIRGTRPTASHEAPGPLPSSPPRGLARHDVVVPTVADVLRHPGVALGGTALDFPAATLTSASREPPVEVSPDWPPPPCEPDCSSEPCCPPGWPPPLPPAVGSPDPPPPADAPDPRGGRGSLRCFSSSACCCSSSMSSNSPSATRRRPSRAARSSSGVMAPPRGPAGRRTATGAGRRGAGTDASGGAARCRRTRIPRPAPETTARPRRRCGALCDPRPRSPRSPAGLPLDPTSRTPRTPPQRPRCRKRPRCPGRPPGQLPHPTGRRLRRCLPRPSSPELPDAPALPWDPSCPSAPDSPEVDCSPDDPAPCAPAPSADCSPALSEDPGRTRTRRPARSLGLGRRGQRRRGGLRRLRGLGAGSAAGSRNHRRADQGWPGSRPSTTPDACCLSSKPLPPDATT